MTSDCHTEKLRTAVEAILTGYHEGTRFGIRADEDGLLRAGEHGYQLTWMDARVDGREITPRIGKPVEIQALWLNALAIGGQYSDRAGYRFWKRAGALSRSASGTPTANIFTTSSIVITRPERPTAHSGQIRSRRRRIAAGPAAA